MKQIVIIITLFCAFSAQAFVISNQTNLSLYVKAVRGSASSVFSLAPMGGKMSYGADAQTVTCFYNKGKSKYAASLKNVSVETELFIKKSGGSISLCSKNSDDESNCKILVPVKN